MKASVKKTWIICIASLAGPVAFGQQNGNPNPQATWFANGKDTVETNRVAKVNNTVEADTLRAKGGIIVGDSSFYIVDDVFVNPNFVDQIRSDNGLIALGQGFNLTPTQVGAGFANIKVGIGVESPRFTLELAGDQTNTNGGILAIGRLYAGPVVPTGLADPRLIWYPRKAAFRAGNATGTHWNDANIGDFSAAFGLNTLAGGDRSFAAGQDSRATGANSVAMGNSAYAVGTSSVSLGEWTQTTGSFSVVLGSYSQAGPRALAFGSNSIAGGNSAVAIGTYVRASGDGAFALGSNTASVVMTNAIANSLMVGFNSDISTLFIGPGSGGGTTGNVGIGYITGMAGGLPNEKLEINSGSTGLSGLRFTQLKSSFTPLLTASEFLTVDPDGNVILANAASAPDGDWDINTFPNDMISIPTGNVGIGTGNTAPAAKLDIFQPDENVPVVKITKNTLGFGGTNDIFQVDKYFNLFNLSVRLFVVSDTGNVGILTPNPTQRLDVNGRARIRQLPLGSPNNALDKIVVTDNDGLLQWRDLNSLSDGDWTRPGNDVMHTTDMGDNVGIGTSTPLSASKLTVFDDQFPAISLSDASAVFQMALATAPGYYSNIATPGDAVIRADAGSQDLILSVRSDNKGAIRFTTSLLPFNDVERMTIQSNGNVGIGTPFPPFKLSVNGFALIGGLLVPSDSLLKTVSLPSVAD